ncbi:MAG TPA: LTA synthase family protein [Sphingobacteriaceae bacterium]
MPDQWFLVLAASWINCSIFWMKTYLTAWALFLILSLFSIRLARVVILTLFPVLLLVKFGLTKYYLTTLVPLGADVFAYSRKDISVTLGSSGALSALSILTYLAIPVLGALSIHFFSRKVKSHYLASLLLAAVSAAFMLSGRSASAFTNSFESDYENNLVLAKEDFFISESVRYFFPAVIETDIYAEGYLGVYSSSEEDGSMKPAHFQYVDENNYPFLRVDSTKDVLSPFFKKADRLPNIVIILVEGLGSAFSNEDAYLGSFTPFIDSLSRQSLYFSNFLSNGGRTFAALPSILASLPFGKNGFIELGSDMPDHLSLITILKKEGYHTSFYYGGDASFDKMDIFLRRNGVDELRDQSTFPKNYRKLPALNGFSWGYDDNALYRHYLNTRPVSTRPQLSIILTVASHSPFLINEPSKYLDKVNSRVDTIRNSAGSKNYGRYKNEYSSILYADDALRSFFEAYRKRPDFGNTIFLITGDHRMPELPMNTKIDRFHVPLLIYSPMLSRTAKVRSVSSHFDVPPTLLAFLAGSYGVKRPALCTWLGQGIDTARNFRNVHAVPLIQTKASMVDFVSGKYHLNSQTVYAISENMNEDIIHDEAIAANLKTDFTRFKQKNMQIVTRKKLIPDSLFSQYKPN